VHVKVLPAPGPVDLRLTVPPSKSLHQRALVLSALSEGPVRFDATGLGPSGDDVRHLADALMGLGRFQGGTVGQGRGSRRLDLGLGATGFRFCMALACLRPAGARTLVTGRPALLRRPHAPLLAALKRLGARGKRRHSGAMRIFGGGLRGDQVHVDGARSSQFASALLLVGARTGGLEVRFTEAPVSRPYLGLTLDALAQFGVGARWLEDGRGIRVDAGAPERGIVELNGDASAAAAWWAAAALTGSRVHVPSIHPERPQADLAILPILEAMGAQVGRDGAGGVVVTGPAGRLASPGVLDLRDAPDLTPLVAALAACAEGTTELHGLEHLRHKETDRIDAVIRMLRALGGRISLPEPGVLRIEGSRLEGAVCSTEGDHRLGFALGVLGLVVPGIEIQRAAAVSKSHPLFFEDLARFAGRDANGGSGQGHG
jgi:3-phosphoshikimate 1-carboxyvinyltransferase